MFKVFLITALVGAVWAKGYPTLKYEQTKVEDDHGLLDEDEVRPQYMKPVYQTQVEYNDEQDLVAEDEPEDKYEQRSVEGFPKRSPNYGIKHKPEGKQGTYKGSDISSEIKHKKNSYEASRITQEEYEIKTISKDFGSRLPKQAPKAYKGEERAPAKGTYKKPQEEEHSDYIGQSKYPHGSGVKSYKPKSTYIAPEQVEVEEDLKSKSTPYKGIKSKDNYGSEEKQVVYDPSMRPGHYGSQGVYMGYSQYMTKDVKDTKFDDKQKSTSYSAPKTYGIYREGSKQKHSSQAYDSDQKGYGNTGYHSGQSSAGTYHNSGLNYDNNQQKKHEESGYGGSSHGISYGGSGSEYSGIGGASGNSHQGSSSSYDASKYETGKGLQSGSGYQSSQGGSYSGYKANERQENKYAGASGYGHNSGSQLQSGSGYQSNYGASHNGYKGGNEASGYGHSAGSHLQSGSGYNNHYGSSNSGYKSNFGEDKSHSASGYGLSAGSHLQSGSGYKGHHAESHSGYKSGANLGIKSSGYGESTDSHLDSGSGYKSNHDASHSGYKSSVNLGIKSSAASGYGQSAGSHVQSGYKSDHGYKSSSNLGVKSGGYGKSAGSHFQSGSGYKSDHGASHSGYKSDNKGIKSSLASGYGINSGSHLQSGLGYKAEAKNLGSYGHSGSSHQNYGNGGAASGIGGHSQYHTSTYSGTGKQHGNNYGSEYSQGHKSGINAASGYGKIASNYGTSSLGGHGYERAQQRNIGNSYHTSTHNYSPSSYQNNKNHGYNQKSIKSVGAKNAYTGGIGASAHSGIKSSAAHLGSNSGISAKGSYHQPKLIQEKHVDQPSIVSVKGGTSYKGSSDIPKSYPTYSKPHYPQEHQPKSSYSGIKGGPKSPKSPKYPIEHKENLGGYPQSTYGSGSTSSVPHTSQKTYTPKGIKGGPISGDIGYSAKKSPYQPITDYHSGSGYKSPSYELPLKGSSDKYLPKKIEQKDLSYDAVLGSPGSSSSGSGSGGYGSSAYSGPVYGSDDKYEMSKPMPYEFKYDIKDDEHGSDHYREEKMDDNGYLTGRYGYKDPYGLYRQVEYQADKDGFKVSSIKTNEPGTDNQDPADAHFEVEKSYQSQY